jgi:hypothetical protein
LRHDKSQQCNCPPLPSNPTHQRTVKSECISASGLRELLLKKPAATPHFVLCNRYDLPIVEFKIARRQGARREHVLCDL